MIAPSYRELRGLSDDDLISHYDHIAKHTQIGTNYLLDEINRRQVDRSTRAVVRMTRVVLWLTVANVVFVAVSTLRTFGAL